MIIARQHKGGLAESMETARKFDTLDEMKEWFCEKWDNLFKPEDVVIDEDVIFDDRINWYTQYVCTKKLGDTIYSVPQCIGMCDLNYPVTLDEVVDWVRKGVEEGIIKVDTKPILSMCDYDEEIAD